MEDYYFYELLMQQRGLLGTKDNSDNYKENMSY